MKIAIKIIISVALIASGWFISIWLNKSEVKTVKSPITKLKEKEVQTEAAIIKREVDKNGLGHTISRMVSEINRSDLDKVQADLLDSAAALGIARSQIKQVTAYALSLEIRNQELERKKTPSGQSLSWKDDNFNILVDVPDDTSKKAMITGLGYNADLVATQYYNSKYKFLPKWVPIYNTLIDVYSNDSRFTNKGVRSLTVTPKRPPISLSLDASGSYNGITGPGLGPGLGLRIRGVYFSGSYQYHPDYGRWIVDYRMKFGLFGSDY